MCHQIVSPRISSKLGCAFAEDVNAKELIEGRCQPLLGSPIMVNAPDRTTVILGVKEASGVGSNRNPTRMFWRN